MYIDLIDIRKAVQELKDYCEQNFFRHEARVIVFSVIDTFSKSEILHCIHPKDILNLSEKNFYYLFQVFKFLRHSDKSARELFGTEWL